MTQKIFESWSFYLQKKSLLINLEIFKQIYIKILLNEEKYNFKLISEFLKLFISKAFFAIISVEVFKTFVPYRL